MVSVAQYRALITQVLASIVCQTYVRHSFIQQMFSVYNVPNDGLGSEIK